MGAEVDVYCHGENCTPPSNVNLHGVSWHLYSPPRASMFSQIFSSYPTICSKHYNWEIIKDLLNVSPPDYYLFDNIGMASYQPVIESLVQKHRTPFIAHVSHNVESDLRPQVARDFGSNSIANFLARLDARKAARVERSLIQTSNLVSTITDQDRDRFVELFGVTNCVTLPPGYDDTYVHHRAITPEVPRNIVILGGRMTVMKQIVLDTCLGAAATGFIDRSMNLHVVGPTPSAYLRKLQLKYPDVHFHGFVDDITPLLNQMRLGILADHVGGGFKLRALSYVFHRIPLVALPSAMLGLPLEPGRDYVPISGNSELAEACDQIVDDFKLLNRLQENAYAKCSEQFSWDATGASLFRAMQSTLPSRDMPSNT